MMAWDTMSSSFSSVIENIRCMFAIHVGTLWLCKHGHN
jgi:hypothetical protein